MKKAFTLLMLSSCGALFSASVSRSATVRMPLQDRCFKGVQCIRRTAKVFSLGSLCSLNIAILLAMHDIDVYNLEDPRPPTEAELATAVVGGVCCVVADRIFILIDKKWRFGNPK